MAGRIQQRRRFKITVGPIVPRDIPGWLPESRVSVEGVILGVNGVLIKQTPPQVGPLMNQGFLWG